MTSESPPMQSWNLALRFVLELGALAGLAVGGWSLGGLLGPVATVVAPLAGREGPVRE